MSSVSIIIPAYNAAHYIQMAVSSALEQSWRNVEVVVVDDGSTDSTSDVVNSIRDSRIRLIRQENCGQCSALNRGVAASKGDFIKFLDADDWLNPEHLASQVAAIRGYRNRVASCRWGYFINHPERARAREEHVNRDYEDPLEWLVDSLTKDEGMMGGWKWLIPRAVWDQTGGWNEQLTWNNDFDFSIRLLLASSGVCFAPEAIYAYRKGSQEAMSSNVSLESAYLATQLGCRSLLDREDSLRIRRLCADRWQSWLFQFYPQFPDLAEKAETEIAALGGSSVKLQGGRALRCLLPVLGWKRVRRLQVMAYGSWWKKVLRWKARRRLAKIG